MKKEYTKAEACQIAHDAAIADTERSLKKAGLNKSKVIKPIVDALSAKTSDNKPDHRVRLDAVKLGIALLNMKPPEQIKVDGNINHNLPDHLTDMFKKIYK